jgi:hypothetical protein
MNATNAILVSEFQKNGKERVRVSLTEFGGHRLIDLRAYYQDATGEWRPGKGLTLRRELLPRLQKALLAAARIEKAEGKGEA